LQACATADDTVPVLVHSGTGTTASPWTVTTLAVTGTACRPITFRLTQADYPLRLPDPRIGTYTGEPAPPAPPR
jgi:hypothetical protein